MKASEIREMTLAERKARLEDLVEEYREMRFGHVMQQLSDPLLLRKVRREIARLKTIISQDAAATAPSVPAEQPAVEGEQA